MNKRGLIGEIWGGEGVSDKSGREKEDPSTRLGRRVEGYEAFVWAKRVMAGSEAQVLEDESYTANLVTLTSLRWTF